ncbi:CHAT domain-containing protein [Streptomyces hoynatensis]|uniref:CHAT domain-containing protein n=1 Tax=Streptomyces hoynatensis TaxID=1141874 RepID=A0A3A9ZCA1_9ACTN|nr:CHAT domain-containing protein [Streptomyces hoynatensis]RKN45890.1 CHAT domain-containing protein [Streptomyces hoynatensis]
MNETAATGGTGEKGAAGGVRDGSEAAGATRRVRRAGRRGRAASPDLHAGLGPGARPVVQLKYADAGALYVTWRWEHALDTPGMVVFPREAVRGVLTELAAALPSPLPGEDVERALARSLGGGAFTDPVRERALAMRLTGLLPGPLAQELDALIGRGIRPRLRVQPSPSTAQVPWEALRGSDGERLVESADVALLPPATVRNSPARRPSPWRPEGPVAVALDPRVPGFPDDSALGSVLGPVAAGSPLAALAERLGPRLLPAGARQAPFRRRDVTREVLEPLLAEAVRFLYVGHVSTADHGLGAALHLGCGPETTGRAALVGAHRPLTAADLVLGHRPEAPRPWRMPNRVAFIACESGGDLRFAEPTGLVAAAVHGGAEYVTATRWTLPTDAGLRHFAPAAGAETSVVPEAVLAVDAAHEAADPVAALNAWQAGRARLWEATGRIEHTPLFWAAFTTTHG